MNRNLPYMKIAVCTSEVQIGEQIREYVDEFTGKGNAQIQVDVMKNCISAGEENPEQRTL